MWEEWLGKKCTSGIRKDKFSWLTCARASFKHIEPVRGLIVNNSTVSGPPFFFFFSCSSSFFFGCGQQQLSITDSKAVWENQMSPCSRKHYRLKRFLVWESTSSADFYLEKTSNQSHVFLGVCVPCRPSARAFFYSPFCRENTFPEHPPLWEGTAKASLWPWPNFGVCRDVLKTDTFQ